MRGDEVICLNVGGTPFYCSLCTLTTAKGSYFDARFSSGFHPGGQLGETSLCGASGSNEAECQTCQKPNAIPTFFIDRNPRYFPFILQFLRDQQTELPRELPPFTPGKAELWDCLEKEADFYCLAHLQYMLRTTRLICSTTEFPFRSDGKGILHHVGTNFGKEEAYNNPFHRGLVRVYRSTDPGQSESRHWSEQDLISGTDKARANFVAYRPMFCQLKAKTRRKRTRMHPPSSSTRVSSQRRQRRRRNRRRSRTNSSNRRNDAIGHIFAIHDDDVNDHDHDVEGDDGAVIIDDIDESEVEEDGNHDDDDDNGEHQNHHDDNIDRDADSSHDENHDNDGNGLIEIEQDRIAQEPESEGYEISVPYTADVFSCCLYDGRITDHGMSQFYVTLELPAGIKVRPSHYSLRHSGINCPCGMESWDFLASKDGIAWTLLHESRRSSPINMDIVKESIEGSSSGLAELLDSTIVKEEDMVLFAQDLLERTRQTFPIDPANFRRSETAKMKTPTSNHNSNSNGDENEVSDDDDTSASDIGASSKQVYLQHRHGPNAAAAPTTEDTDDEGFFRFFRISSIPRSSVPRDIAPCMHGSGLELFGQIRQDG